MRQYFNSFAAAHSPVCECIEPSIDYVNAVEIPVRFLSQKKNKLGEGLRVLVTSRSMVFIRLGERGVKGYV